MKIYVGTYKKYNEGNLFGRWMDLEYYSNKEAFIKECKRLHSDESNPELMFQDYEGIHKSLINESYIDDEIYNYIELCNEKGKENIDCLLDNNIPMDTEFTVIDTSGAYSSKEESLGYYLIEDCGYLEIPENIKYYFDYELYGKDAMIEGNFLENSDGDLIEILD